MSAHLEKLVTEWRDAQRAIDQQTAAKKREILETERHAAIARLVAAHNALKKYAEEEMG